MSSEILAGLTMDEWSNQSLPRTKERHMIPLSIPAGQRWIELGCGDDPHPACHVRVDVRDIPGVTHFSCDLGKFPWPIGDGHFDGVYSCFVIEHVGWRNTRQFVKELFRILRPGGRAVIVGPNTEAQMRHLLATQDWEDAGSMLFGGQDYPENSHRAAFSPAFYEKVFTEAGFVNVVTQAWGVKMTDMIVEAAKPEANIDDLRRQHYERSIAPLPMRYETVNSEPIIFAPSRIHEAELAPPTPSVREILEGKVTVQGDSSKHQQMAKELLLAQPAYFDPEMVEDMEEGPTVSMNKEQTAFLREMMSTVQTPSNPPEVEEAVRELREDLPQSVQQPHIVELREHLPSEKDLNLGGLYTVTPPSTDLQAEAHKNVVNALREQADLRRLMFGRDYFDGGRGKWGGYREGYRDFPWNETTARLVLARRPESVLELGCARGYLLKRLQDHGLYAVGADISKHAHMTRVADRIYQEDLLTPWCSEIQHVIPTGGKIDLCLSLNFLEHVPEALLPHVIQYASNSCKRHLHGVLVEGKDDGSDRTRCTVRPLKWWHDLFKQHCRVPWEVVDVDELRNGQMSVDVTNGDGKVKLNVGSYTTMFYHGWLNMDVIDLTQYAQGYGYKFQQHDMRRPLHQFGTGTVDLIYSAHALEHVTYAEGLAFLKECRRVLKPDTGAMRLIVPDAQLLMGMYNKLDPLNDGHWCALSEFDEINVGCAQQPSPAGKLWSMLGEGHKAAYDAETLVKMLEQAGFQACQAKFRNWAINRTGIQQILRETQDVLPSCSLYVDAVPNVG